MMDKVSFMELLMTTFQISEALTKHKWLNIDAISHHNGMEWLEAVSKSCVGAKITVIIPTPIY